MNAGAVVRLAGRVVTAVGLTLALTFALSWLEQQSPAAAWIVSVLAAGWLGWLVWSWWHSPHRIRSAALIAVTFVLAAALAEWVVGHDVGMGGA